MEGWYYIASDEPHRKCYCMDYGDVHSMISLDSMFKVPRLTKFLDDSTDDDRKCPDYSIYKDGELIEVVTGEKLTEVYLEENKEVLADYAKKKQEGELRCKKMVNDFNSLNSSMEGINNAMKNLVDSLNELNGILNRRW